MATPANTFNTAADSLTFMLAGNSRITIQSEKTGTRYTYKIAAAKDNGGKPGARLYFVSLLTGSDNESDYTYMGIIRRQAGDTNATHTPQFTVTAKSRYKSDSVPALAFSYVLRYLTNNRMPDSVTISHEGRCGRCNRTLTVPESIATGLGPECAQKMAA